MATTIKTTFQLRRGNAEVWAKNNPILAAGEPGFELDTGKLKIGNGNDTYNDLSYIDSRLFTFTITPTNGPGSQMLSATRAEMLAALDAGKTLLGYWTETRTILGTTDTIKHEFRLESVSGTGADRGLAFVNYEQFYKSTLYVNGNDTVSFVNKEQLPNPTTKTEAMTQSVGMDNDGRLWTEPGASGGSSDSGKFIVVVYSKNHSGTLLEADKTYNEIRAAIESEISVVVHRKYNINNADYKVFYLTENSDWGFRFCNYEPPVLGEERSAVLASFIDIYEENGEMGVEERNIKLQIVT